MWTARRSLRLAALKTRAVFAALLWCVLGLPIGTVEAQTPSSDSSSLDFKQWGLLAIQDAGRRKPIDTFSREALIKITGRSTYKDQAGRKWQANDLVLSALLETHDWKNEPMVLISLGALIEQLGLDKTKRRFAFKQLSELPEFQKLAGEARDLRRAEKPLSRVQQEVMNVSERLTLLQRIMDGSSFLIVPAVNKVTNDTPACVAPAA